MLRPRLGLKGRVLGLGVLALGLMALSASGAQAEAGAFWSIVMSKGELIEVNNTNKLFAQVQIKEIENNTLTLRFTTKGGTKVSFLCTTMEFDEGGQLIAEGGLSLSRSLFKGCITILNGNVVSACKPTSGGKPSGSGELLSEKFTGLLALSGSVAILKIAPEGSGFFFVVELGAKCSILETVTVAAANRSEEEPGGALWLKANTSLKEEKVEHLIVEASGGLIALGQPAILEGSILMTLAGVHNGLKWGGTPG